MCVTNIAKRRNLAVVGNANVGTNSSNNNPTSSLLSQRLMGNFAFLNKAAVPVPIGSGVGVVNSNHNSHNSNHNMPMEVPFLDGSMNLGPMDMNAAMHVNTVPEKKKRPKRRRKPQKPGKTAKQNDRHFVVHNYHDHSADTDEHDEDKEEENAPRRGGVATSFPQKLHAILDRVEADGLGHIVSWQPHGRCFVIHKPKEFTDHVMPHYFRQSKLTSFQRQLNLYGFARLTRGKDAGGYYHEFFLRGKLFLAKKMQRTKIKGTKFKAASSPDQEPDFYSMPALGPSHSQAAQLHMVSDDSSADCDMSQHHQHQQASIARPMLQQSVPANLDLMAPFSTMPNVNMNMAIMHNGLDPAPIQQQQQQQANMYSMPSFTPAWSGNFQLNHNKVAADDILDAAVDELFQDTTPNVISDSNSSSPSWNQSTQNHPYVPAQNGAVSDVRLGFMLESLIGL
eukprot:Nitzschia sp. Nitz4//scaffold133_size116822//4807//6162//NITZ4_003790-RA/size116822-processed-gene-0.47-mRNA-1//-1//CDS//3329535345//4610//frame0